MASRSFAASAAGWRPSVRNVTVWTSAVNGKAPWKSPTTAFTGPRAMSVPMEPSIRTTFGTRADPTSAPSHRRVIVPPDPSRRNRAVRVCRPGGSATGPVARVGRPSAL